MSYDYLSNFLTPLQLKRLSEHKYSSSGNTFLDPYFQVFWNWLVTKLPLSLAPNLLTVGGLAITIITSLILIAYSPDATQEVPKWAIFLAALGIFVYQTLDSLDGKQARRTGSSSPLGELLDHGCDAVTTIVLILGVSISQQIGTHPCWLFFFCFTSMFMYYCAHWQTYVSGSLTFSRFDVLECQWAMILIHLVTLILGHDVWAIKVPMVNLELKIVSLLFCLVGASVALFNYLTIIFTGGVGKNGSTVAGTSVLSPIIPITLVILPAFIIYRKSPSFVFENHPCLYTLAFSQVFSKYTIKIVVAHMTKWELQYLDTVLIGPALLFLNQYFNTFLSEYLVLWAALIYGLADLAYFSVCLCHQLCSYLNISMFTISPFKTSTSSETRTIPDDQEKEPLDFEANMETPLLDLSSQDASKSDDVSIHK